MRSTALVSILAGAFGIVEATVVVYLRALYYPEGFAFPLRMMSQDHIVVEQCREVATIIMLVSVGILAGKSRWERFAYFLLAFGVWDLVYYGWLKAVLNWPTAVTDWDVLFLIPVPWIAPVVVPVLIASLMIVVGIVIVRRLSLARRFRPPLLSWLFSAAATMMLLYSFVLDLPATVNRQMPAPYEYTLFVVAMVLYVIGFLLACRNSAQVAHG